MAHQYYSPSEEEVKRSKEILRSDEEARRNGVGVAIINGKFIGPPFVAKAKKILKLNESILKNKKNG